MTGRRAGVLLAIAAVLVACLVVFGLQRERSTAAALERNGDASVARAVASTREPSELAPFVDATARIVADASTPPANVRRSVELHGRVVALGPDGVEMRNASGTFGLIAWRAGSSERAPISIVGGTWHVSPMPNEPIDHFELDGAFIGGVDATIESPRGEWTAPVGGELEIVVRISKCTRLRVVSAEDGTELSNVRLMAHGELDDEHSYPGPESSGRVLDSGLSSPFLVDGLVPQPSRGQPVSLFVGREGFAWANVTVDLARGGDYSVSLVRSGALDVEIVGGESSKITLFRLRSGSAESPLFTEKLYERSEIVLGSLAPGNYTVSCEIDRARGASLVLGQVELLVTAGSTTRGTLTLAPEPHTASASGTLYIAEGWPNDSPMVELVLLDKPRNGFESRQVTRAQPQPCERLGFRRFDWSFTGLQAGRYKLGVVDPPVSMEFDVSFDASWTHLLEVRPPVDVVVRVVDADTGRNVEVDGLDWTYESSSAPGGALLAQQANAGVYEFRVPEGRLEVTAWDFDRELASETLDVRAPRFELTLRVKRD